MISCSSSFLLISVGEIGRLHGELVEERLAADASCSRATALMRFAR